MGKETYLDVLDVGPMSGDTPLSFHLHCTLNETDGPGLNGKDVDLFVDGEVVQTIESHGIFGWYGATGWVNGCCDFTVQLKAGDHEVYAEFPGDDEWNACETEHYIVTVKSIPEEHSLGTVGELVTFKPPDYDFTLELVVPTFEGSWIPERHHTVISGKFYASSADIEGLTLNYSIYNKTDDELIDSGEFTPAESNFWHKQTAYYLADDLRGKTIQFRFWNPNENNEKSLKLHGASYISDLY